MSEATISFGRRPKTPGNATGGLEVFDPAMCCSSGVCGPDVDPRLVQFAADLAWLKSQGIPVQRHNLSQDPAQFIANPLVQSALNAGGEAALPIVLRSGSIASQGRYPDRTELAAWFDLSQPSAAAEGNSCCSGTGCC